MNETEQVRSYIEKRIEIVKSTLDDFIDVRVKADEQIRKLTDMLETFEAMLRFVNEAEGKKPAELAPMEREVQELQAYGEMSIADGAFIVLSHARRPLHVGKIWDALQRGGKTSKAKKPILSVTAALLRDERFENLGGNTFTVKEVPRDTNGRS